MADPLYTWPSPFLGESAGAHLLRPRSVETVIIPDPFSDKVTLRISQAVPKVPSALTMSARLDQLLNLIYGIRSRLEVARDDPDHPDVEDAAWRELLDTAEKVGAELRETREIVSEQIGVSPHAFGHWAPTGRQAGPGDDRHNAGTSRSRASWSDTPALDQRIADARTVGVATPPRLQALPLPDGRFALIVTGGGLVDDDFDTLRSLARQIGAVEFAVFVGDIEVG